MQKTRNFVPYFLVFFLLSLFILVASQAGALNTVEPVFGAILAPLQTGIYSEFSAVVNMGSDSKVRRLESENLSLTNRLVDQNKLVQDNRALMDQFKTQNLKSSGLIPAQVVGAPGFIPGISVPQTLIIDKGQNDGVRIGDAVIYQSNLLGEVTKSSPYLSSVTLITNPSSSFTAETLNTKTLGVISGQGGGEMILGNVLLSDTLQKNDIVLTKGNTSLKGIGFPPDLVVGKILSISKNPSDLFQKAEVKSLINFAALNKVFVISLQ